MKPVLLFSLVVSAIFFVLARKGKLTRSRFPSEKGQWETVYVCTSANRTFRMTQVLDSRNSNLIYKNETFPPQMRGTTVSDFIMLPWQMLTSLYQSASHRGNEQGYQILAGNFSDLAKIESLATTGATLKISGKAEKLFRKTSSRPPRITEVKLTIKNFQNISHPTLGKIKVADLEESLLEQGALRTTLAKIDIAKGIMIETKANFVKEGRPIERKCTIEKFTKLK